MSYLKLENLDKYFGDYHALKDINLEADAGAFVVLLGPSGCGKSTLLRLITGLIEEHEGRILINGRDVTDLDPKDRSVAMVFQSYALYPHLTVARNISFGMEINKVPKLEREAKTLKAAQALQLENLLDRYPVELSGGQRQRVAIGRCLVREPDLFLFDEPLSNLDAKLRHETRIELKQLQHRLQTTTVYVTHDQHEAMTLATKVVLMDEGVIVQTAPPMELYGDPINRFAATFIGTPQINLFKGTLRKNETTTTFEADGVTVRVAASCLKGDVTDGQMAELGIRAENADIVDLGKGDAQMLVEYVEETGSDTFLNGTVGGQAACFRINRKDHVDAGATVNLKLDLDALIFFDLESGERV